MDLKTNVNKQNRIAIIGPIIIDSKSSGGEGEKLYQKLKEEGYTVYKRSIHRGKFQRMINTLWFLLTKSKEYDTVILLLFSGKAFILEYISAILAKFLSFTPTFRIFLIIYLRNVMPFIRPLFS